MAFYLASTYGGGTYNSNVYNAATTTSTGTTGSSSAGGTTGTLSNTGFDIALIASLACVIAFSAIVVRIWKRPVKQEQAV